VNCITLTTDFGTRDWFVGTMKGVIASIAPETRVIDLTHDVRPGDIRAGALALGASHRFFPKGTVHLVVVDPGVGSRRKAIAVQTNRGIFVAPDNGVLSWALAKEKISAIRSLENSAYFLKPVSMTFHGRDVFAPAAAHLSLGMPIQKLGPALKDFVRLECPRPCEKRSGFVGEVVYVDRFGNAITNLERGLLRGLSDATCEVHARHRKLCPVKTHYQAVAPKSLVAVVGSSGFVEIAVNGGSAEKAFGLKLGTRVVLRGADLPSRIKV
jgi:S-adenosyl-L-methionine hydrolase (adenosine-forming)